MKTALIIVDVQNDFVTGSLATDPEQKIVPHMVEYVKTTGNDYDVVITTQDWHINPGDHWVAEGEEPDFAGTWPVHCAAETPGAALYPALEETLKEVPHIRVLKGQFEASYSGFDGKTEDGISIADFLVEKGVTTVDVMGIATDYCVKETAKDSVIQGFDTYVLADYVQGVDAEESENLLDTGFEEYGVRVKGRG